MGIARSPINRHDGKTRTIFFLKPFRLYVCMNQSSHQIIRTGFWYREFAEFGMRAGLSKPSKKITFGTTSLSWEGIGVLDRKACTARSQNGRRYSTLPRRRTGSFANTWFLDDPARSCGYYNGLKTDIQGKAQKANDNL